MFELWSKQTPGIQTTNPEKMSQLPYGATHQTQKKCHSFLMVQHIKNKYAFRSLYREKSGLPQV